MVDGDRMKALTLYRIIPPPIRNIPKVERWLDQKAEAEIAQARHEIIQAKWKMAKLESELKGLKDEYGN